MPKANPSSNCSPQTADATSLDMQNAERSDPARMATQLPHAKGYVSETCSKMFACNASGYSKLKHTIGPHQNPVANKAL